MPLEASHPDRYRVLRRVGKRRLVMLAAAVLLLLALGAAGAAYALSGRDSTTVTITPTSRTVSNTYTISAVTSLPDASRQQVAARLVSATTPAQTRTVKASGRLSLAATQARGMLTLHNWSAAPRTFTAGTVFPDLSEDLVVNCGSAPSDIVLDATITVPAAGGLLRVMEWPLLRDMSFSQAPVVIFRMLRDPMAASISSGHRGTVLLGFIATVGPSPPPATLLAARMRTAVRWSSRATSTPQPAA